MTSQIVVNVKEFIVAYICLDACNEMILITRK